MKKAKVFQTLGLSVVVLTTYLLSATALAAAGDLVSMRETLVSPLGLLENKEASSVQLTLLDWEFTGQLREKPGVEYSRRGQFGRWIQFKKTPGCYDVRAQVLIRDSLIPAISTDKIPCTIEKGEWLDPYSGVKAFEDDQVQIDHMVPLKEAYTSGAYAWTQAQRCVYANFTGMKEHLIATSNFENLSKSDKTPEQYMPPLREYQCTYLKNWLSVKLIWKLSLSQSEAEAIRARMKEAGCMDSDFTISKQKVDEVRTLARSLEAVCPVPRVTVKKIPTPEKSPVK